MNESKLIIWQWMIFMMKVYDLMTENERINAICTARIWYNILCLLLITNSWRLTSIIRNSGLPKTFPFFKIYNDAIGKTSWLFITFVQSGMFLCSVSEWIDKWMSKSKRINEKKRLGYAPPVVTESENHFHFVSKIYIDANNLQNTIGYS